MHIEEDLIKSCISQNRQSQKQLYILLLPYLRAVVNRYLRDTSYSKDVLQESFVKIFVKLESYDINQAPLKQWSARIAINNCFNYNSRVIGIPKEEFSLLKHQPIVKPISEDLSKDDMLNALKQMPTGYFEVFNLFVIDGYSHEEISSILKINEALSRKRLSRARSWVKKTFVNKANGYFNTNSASQH